MNKRNSLNGQWARVDIWYSTCTRRPLHGLIILHWEYLYCISFQIEWDMIMVTVFLSILNQMDIHLVQNRKENSHHDHTTFKSKGIGIEVFSVWRAITIWKFNRDCGNVSPRSLKGVFNLAAIVNDIPVC